MRKGHRKSQPPQNLEDWEKKLIEQLQGEGPGRKRTSTRPDPKKIEEYLRLESERQKAILAGQNPPPLPSFFDSNSDSLSRTSSETGSESRLGLNSNQTDSIKQSSSSSIQISSNENNNDINDVPSSSSSSLNNSTVKIISHTVSTSEIELTSNLNNKQTTTTTTIVEEEIDYSTIRMKNAPLLIDDNSSLRDSRESVGSNGTNDGSPSPTNTLTNSNNSNGTPNEDGISLNKSKGKGSISKGHRRTSSFGITRASPPSSLRSTNSPNTSLRGSENGRTSPSPTNTVPTITTTNATSTNGNGNNDKSTTQPAPSSSAPSSKGVIPAVDPSLQQLLQKQQDKTFQRYSQQLTAFPSFQGFEDLLDELDEEDAKLEAEEAKKIEMDSKKPEEPTPTPTPEPTPTPTPIQAPTPTTSTNTTIVEKITETTTIQTETITTQSKTPIQTPDHSRKSSLEEANKSHHSLVSLLLQHPKVDELRGSNNSNGTHNTNDFPPSPPAEQESSPTLDERVADVKLRPIGRETLRNTLQSLTGTDFVSNPPPELMMLSANELKLLEGRLNQRQTRSKLSMSNLREEPKQQQ